ncbi:hypothetical protein [Paenibacillus sp. J5C2022]|uniref:hypothetical protein n=1 Tax=Paenibacillus sp. J5C2022 TaxID=2977129 RepID=UPI00293EA9C9|nr:hypothetical protein [Paenibacillus sp. J5C2022]
MIDDIEIHIMELSKLNEHIIPNEGAAQLAAVPEKRRYNQLGGVEGARAEGESIGQAFSPMTKLSSPASGQYSGCITSNLTGISGHRKIAKHPESLVFSRFLLYGP